MQNIEQNSHITENTWIALSNDTIAPGDYMKILEHTCSCTWCAERLASVMEDGEQAQEPPAYLEGQILERAGQLDIQVQMSMKRTERKISNQLKLFTYSLKVGLAVAVSVFLLVISANIQELGMAGGQDSWEQNAGQQSLWGQNAEQQSSREQDFRQPEAEEQEDGFLEKMNMFSQNITSQMNSFSNFLLNMKD